MTDVLIVGAGLAGSAAAIQLARRGYAVEILDQASFPRRKPCGEGLFSHGVQELAALGVFDDVSSDAAVLESMSFSLDGRTVEAPLPASFTAHLGIRRDVLDGVLFNAAAKAGARMRTGIQVRKAIKSGNGFELETTQGVFGARVIMAADGIHSRIRGDAGLDRPTRARRFGVSAHLKTARTIPPQVQISFEKHYEVYVTPVGPQSLNVALLMKDPQSMGFKGNLAGRFRELIEAAGIEGELTDEPMMAGPFPASTTALSKDNLVLIGDAAGFFDPITGEGMSLALRSARLGASAVARYLSGDSRAFAHYERQHRAMTRNPIMLAQLMLFLAAHRSLGKQAIENLQGRPETLTRLIAVNNGLSGLTELRLRDLAALVLGR